MKALPINLTFVGSADLFESDTSSDELVVEDIQNKISFQPDRKSLSGFFSRRHSTDKERGRTVFFIFGPLQIER